jgi:hypothetical protein
MRAFVLYNSNEENNCAHWSEDKRDMRGCGESCECPRMTNSFDRFDQLTNYLSMIKNSFLTLDDISDMDWNDMNSLMLIEAEEKKKEEEHAKKIKDIFG